MIKDLRDRSGDRIYIPYWLRRRSSADGLVCLWSVAITLTVIKTRHHKKDSQSVLARKKNCMAVNESHKSRNVSNVM